MSFVKIASLSVVALLMGTAIAEARSVKVRAHYRGGQYVPEHYRSSPDSSRDNNWSTIGNRNPHTGRAGYLPGGLNRGGAVAPAAFASGSGLGGGGSINRVEIADQPCEGVLVGRPAGFCVLN